MKHRAAIVGGVGLSAALGISASAEAAVDTITVTSLTDPGDGDCATNGCTLREAITQADDGDTTDVDQIVFQSGLSGTITLDGTQLPTIDEPLYIDGPGADVLTIGGNSSSRIFKEQGLPGPWIELTIEGVTLSGGSSSPDAGGAISNRYSHLTIRDSTISDNSTTGFGGGVYTRGSSTTIENSTLSGNQAGEGSAVVTVAATTTIESSTISGNFGHRAVEAIMTELAQSFTIRDSTVAGNSFGGVLAVFYSGCCGPMPVTSTLLADNTGSGFTDLAGGPFQLGFSLVENLDATTSPATGPNVIGADPQVGALADNGGPTQTMMPASTSPAIDQGFGGSAGTDQRGQPRVFDVPTIVNAAGGDGADIGAFELQASGYVPPAATPPPVSGFNQKAAIKKCKKKYPGKAKAKKRKKCIKKAKKLPV